MNIPEEKDEQISVTSLLDRFDQFFSHHKLLEGIYRVDYYFDEPHQYSYAARVKVRSPYFKINSCAVTQDIIGNGFSFFNNASALLKCFGEATERICQETFNPLTIRYDTPYHLEKAGFSVVRDKSIDHHQKIGWVLAKNLSAKTQHYLPAQYAYYTYKTEKEPVLTNLISTGGAAGTEHSRTILAGLYELIERDTFTTTYLLKAPVRKIAIEQLPDQNIQYILSQLKRYRLQAQVFDITHDLEVPVFFCILIDETGKGPAVTTGASASFHHTTGIIKSISEACMSRPWIRSSLISKQGYEAIIKSASRGIRDRLERALYWYPRERIKKLSFWLDKKPLSYRPRKQFTSPADELSFISDLLNKKGYPLFYFDLTHQQLKKYGFRVYKVVSPSLHGLFLDEKNTYINYARLDAVARYFGIPSKPINRIPHPFL